jgi:hypothetical protein
MQLQDYLNDTAWLLHDVNNLFTPVFQLTRWVNQARDQVAQDSGCIRTVVTGQSPFGAQAQAGVAVPGGAIAGIAPTSLFYTIAQQEKYPFAYANQTAVAQQQGARGVIGVNNVAVSWGGALRPVQNWLPWDQMQALGRSYNVGVFSYPFCWATSGTGENNQVWLWPAPSIASEMEWDCTLVPKQIYSNDDFDAIQAPFDQAVKYWAARLAFMGSLRYAEADEMTRQYWLQLNTTASASDRGHVPDYYADVSRW